MKNYSLIIFGFLFTLTNCGYALTTKIDKEDVRTTQLQSCANSRFVEIKFYSVYIDGENQETLSCIEKYEEDENIKIESHGKTVSLPLDFSQRLLKLLHSGWQSVLRYHPFIGLPVGYGGSNPSCSFIMFHVAFGVTDFTTERFSIEEADQLELESSLEEIVNELQIGDVVILIGLNSRFNKNATYYLGNDLFLTWDSYSTVFRFQDSKQIHSCFEERYKLLILRKRIITPVSDDNPPSGNASAVHPIVPIVKSREAVLPNKIEPYSYVN